MRRHPSWKGDALAWLDDADRLDREAIDDLEAIQLANAARRSYGWVEHSTPSRPVWWRVAGQVVVIVGLLVLVMAITVIGDMTGGWAA